MAQRHNKGKIPPPFSISDVVFCRNHALKWHVTQGFSQAVTSLVWALTGGLFPYTCYGKVCTLGSLWPEPILHRWNLPGGGGGP
jgi:hypothetical protein